MVGNTSTYTVDLIIETGDGMYTILINDDNTMTVTQKQRIVQRSKLVDDLHFLVNPTYNGRDMSASTVLMEYVTPATKKYKTEILEVSNELYKDHLEYTLPVDTEITEEAGDVEILLSFIYVDLNADGESVQRVRKISPAYKLHVYPVSAWCDIIPDSALSALDQRIIKIDAQMKAIEEMNLKYDESKADNIAYDAESNSLQLTGAGKPIGDVVQIRDCEGAFGEDGIPVVDFENISGGSDNESDQPIIEDNVVEF